MLRARRRLSAEHRIPPTHTLLYSRICALLGSAPLLPSHPRCCTALGWILGSDWSQPEELQVWPWQGVECQKQEGPFRGLHLGSPAAQSVCEPSLTTLGVKGHPELGNTQVLRGAINSLDSRREQRFCEGQKLRKGMGVGSDEKQVARIEGHHSLPPLANLHFPGEKTQALKFYIRKVRL